jgi:hypothetical protein
VLAPAGTSHPARAAAAANSTPTLTIYSKTRKQQFLSTSDDRLRGIGTSPFGSSTGTGGPTTVGTGPFPGDLASFLFYLYSDQSLQKRIGTAKFSCRYEFNKNAFCQATYEFGKGTMYAAGAFNFASTQFVLAVTGGTGQYTYSKGEVTITTGQLLGDIHLQRVVFSLV